MIASCQFCDGYLVFIDIECLKLHLKVISRFIHFYIILMMHLPGVSQYARVLQSPLETWLKFVDEQMLKKIVENTNIYIRKGTANEIFDYRKKEASVTKIKAVHFI